ncbi:helix-turn-helix domain-containing protein [Streptomyces sp. NBC_00161]|uniref:helix-turn-helix domain-containing protein n=1 Tax=Streptomyces sp. NBC_00161 TaxID=2975671 RepID=UPI00386B69EA
MVKEREALAELQARLRVAIAARGISLASLAMRARLGRTTVSQALNGHGRPSLNTLMALCQTLRMDQPDLDRLLELWRVIGAADGRRSDLM